MLIFLPIFIPGFLVGVHLFLNAFPIPFPDYVIYSCIAVPILMAVGYNVVLLQCKRPLRWMLRESRIIYESPAFLLGRSFDIAESDLIRVVKLGRSDYAVCETVTGGSCRFQCRFKGGRKFFEHLLAHTTPQSDKTKLSPPR